MGDVNNYNNNFVGFKGVAANGGQSLWQLPMPNISITNNNNFNPGFLDVFDPYINGVNATYQMQFSEGFAVLNPVNDLTQEQINHGVYIEMMYYKNAHKSKLRSGLPDASHNKRIKWSVPADNRFNTGLDGFENSFAVEIHNQWNCGNLNSRFGQQNFGGTTIGINRPNQIKITDKNISYDLHQTLNGCYSFFNCEYQDASGGSISDIPTLYPCISKKGKGGWGGRKYTTLPATNPTFPRAWNLNNVKTYNSNYKNLYIKYRYVMFNPALNNGNGDFVTGPTSNTICVTPKVWAFTYAPQTPTNLWAKTTSINGLYNPSEFFNYKMNWTKTLQ